MEFAIIRCGFGMNQTKQDDAQWLNNVKGCEENNIPYQREVIDQGGTDASSMNQSHYGVRTGGIVVVTRYPHCQSAVASKKDIEAGVDLMNAFSRYTFKF